MLTTGTVVDSSQGEQQTTGNPLDVALQGDGYFAVKSGSQIRLTRNGQFMVDRQGNLIMANGAGNPVLDNKQLPIHLESTAPVEIDKDGTISQNSKPIGRLGVFTVTDPKKIVAQGGTLLAYPSDQDLIPASASFRSGAIERSNVDTTTELTSLMDVQRQLQANANMIQTQDETLDKLINDAGKIS